MSKRPVELLLEDIREAIERVQEYTKEISEDAFLQDRRTSDAVVRNFEIIGEAASRNSGATMQCAKPPPLVCHTRCGLIIGIENPGTRD